MLTPNHSLSAAFVSDLLALHAALNETALNKARDCLLDFLGAALAGAHETRASHEAILSGLGTECTATSVLGLGARADLLTAGLLNGMSAHHLELDDGHRYGMVHPGATVIAALLPLAQARAVDDGSLLRAIVVGYEAAIRLAMAVQPGMKHRGYHATGTCGAIGAAMSAGVLLGQDSAQLHTTLCVAATQAAGLLQVIREGSDLKPFNAGQAALHGLLAATMGNVGFTGPADVFGGAQGLLKVLSDTPQPGRLADIGREAPAIHGIYVKPYAACRHCHPAIEATLVLRNRERLDIAEVDSVQVHTYGLAVHLHDHRRVQNTADARMSTPYSVAAALRFGAADMAQFNPKAMADPELQRVLDSVEVVEDPALTAEVPRERAARLTITLRDGRSLQQTVPLPKGEPENPLTPSELLDKFRSLAAHVGLPPERAAEIIAFISGERPGIAQLYATL
ncbi:MmgE/PrpD family protein [Thioalkalivibrio sp.]|uniref:MmgE/PrpD family protein n=1 Tax=Thioalkalivibrio sp. TaxID=2093813 RepID=UPI00356378D2